MATKSFPDDCAFVYRGVRIYHTFRDLAAGRQNATCSENWLTWKFSDRDLDSPNGHQFDLRDLPKAPGNYKSAATPRYVSALLTADEVKKLVFYIDSHPEVRK
jgi:hypothetical protein